MGNANQKEALYEAVDADNCDAVREILKVHPQIINEPASEDVPTTPLERAAWRGNVEMVYTLLELGADVNFVGPQRVSPLQWASQRGKDETVDYLVQKGAKLDFLSKENLNALDYAILYGSYNIAWKLQNLGVEPKNLDFYKTKSQEKHILYYDYEKMLEHLKRKVPLEECPPFNIPPPEKGFVDPVIDPRETWSHFAKRILEFEEPPLVERSELPPELRPENRLLGRIRSLINGQSPYPEEGKEQADVEAEVERNKEKQNNPEESVVLTEEGQDEDKDGHRVENRGHFVNMKNIEMKDSSDKENRKEVQNHEDKEKEAYLSQSKPTHSVELQPIQVNIENRDEQ